MFLAALTAVAIVGDGIARIVNAAHNNRIKDKINKVNSKLNKYKVEYDRLLGEMQSELRKKGDQQALDRLESEKDRAKQAKLLSQYLEKEASESLRQQALEINNKMAEQFEVIKNDLGIKMADLESINNWNNSTIDRELSKAVSNINAETDAYISMNTVSGESKNAKRYNIEMVNKVNKAKNDKIAEWEKLSTIETIKNNNTTSKEKDKLSNKAETTMQQMQNSVNSELDRKQNQINYDKNQIINKLDDKHDKDTINEIKKQQEEYNKLESDYQDKLNANRVEQGKLETTISALQNQLK